MCALPVSAQQTQTQTQARTLSRVWILKPKMRPREAHRTKNSTVHEVDGYILALSCNWCCWRMGKQSWRSDSNSSSLYVFSIYFLFSTEVILMLLSSLGEQICGSGVSEPLISGTLRVLSYHSWQDKLWHSQGIIIGHNTMFFKNQGRQSIKFNGNMLPSESRQIGFSVPWEHTSLTILC